jgi:hypothetical protein
VVATNPVSKALKLLEVNRCSQCFTLSPTTLLMVSDKWLIAYRNRMIPAIILSDTSSIEQNEQPKTIRYAGRLILF